LLANDVAELLASSSASVGVERALRPAIASVDRETLARTLDRLHPWALSGATRAALKARPGLLESLRAAVAAHLEESQTGPHPPAAAPDRLQHTV
jgi:undecaprenyl-diphosphatase